jgi:NCAIR mutase (PurE)-related protein
MTLKKEDIAKLSDVVLSDLRNQITREINKRVAKSYNVSFDNPSVRTQNIEEFIANKAKKEEETKKAISSFPEEDQVRVTTYSELYKHSLKTDKESADKMWNMVEDIFAKNDAKNKVNAFKKHI